jgi:hypothetical protein
MIFDFTRGGSLPLAPPGPGDFTEGGSLPLAPPGPLSRVAAKPRRARLLVELILGLMVVGCGNYSNDDLEYMNAVPAGNQLVATLPAYSAALPVASEAELAQTTHSVTTQFNQMIDSTLGGVDAIRSYEPSSRTPTSRTWGPFASTNQVGWDWRLIVSHDDPQSTTFTYELDVENTVDTSAGWLTFVTGSFDATEGVRKGMGSMTVTTDPLAKAGFPFDQGAAPFTMLTVTYSTLSYPITVDMTIDRTADALNPVTSVVYRYAGQADGSGQMSFTLTGNLVAGPAIETVAVVSAWLPTGAGEATETVEQGDAAGLTQTECWNTSFAATYNSKPWSPTENLGDPTACPSLPSFAN